MRIRYEMVLPIYHLIWRNWREKRFEKFRQLMAMSCIERLLDVGGNPGDWYGRGELVMAVDALNLQSHHISNVPENSPCITSLAGDGTHLPFGDQSYELVYSNSVIEHVGDQAAREAFALEIRRVGRKIWVQTPAYGCPIEPHYLGLFVHWLPRSWQWPFIRWTTFIGLTGAAGEDGLKSIMETTELLRKKEFQKLFPDCEIWVERLFWVFPKSYVAYKS
jgi:hypothetical protein